MKENKEKWLLFQFKTPRGDMVTRGRNVDEARFYINEVVKVEILHTYDYCDITAAFQYSLSHQFDWLNNPPRWFDPTRKFVPNDSSFYRKFYHGKTRR